MDSDYACEPTNENYVLTLEIDSLTYTCSSTNNVCEMQACLCDLELIRSLVEKVNLLDSYFQASNGWLPEDNCVAGEAHFPVDQCCGSYPQRFPYSTAAGKGCCNGKTFNSNAFECCASGSIETIGTCGFDPCYPNPCVYGTCQPSPFAAGNFQCSCFPNWTGNICDERICSDDICKNGGISHWNGSKCGCTCPTGFSGLYCEESVCDGFTCHHFGTPTVSDDGTCSCTCPDGYYGNNCELTPCSIQPCGLHGTCSEEDNSFVCECELGYSGPTCGTSICDLGMSISRGLLDQCGINGQCVIMTDDWFQCLCSEGYFGESCEFGPCDALTCFNGGQKTLTGTGCVCTCPAPYT